MKSPTTAPLLFDGAFGTYYFALTGDEAPCELANLTARETVERIHREYIEAGAAAIKTNTFAANPARITDRARLRAVLEAGWAAANAAAGSGARVFADIGGSMEESAREDYLAVAEEFLALGAREFLFETLPDWEPARPAVRLIRERRPDAVIFVSFAVSQDGYTRRGLYYKGLLDGAGREADAVGLNCICGPSHMRRLARGVSAASPKPFMAMPNAGYPSSLNGRMIFEDNVGYFAHRLEELYLDGADILGGCCGTTPRHIRAAAELLRGASRPGPARPETAPAPAGERAARVKRPHKTIAVELNPPFDYDCSFLLSASAAYKACGADLITVTDSPLSRTRADSLMTAAKIRREAGIEVLPHLSCRDRNHIALRAGLLGAAFEGISRVLVVTGDPLPQEGRHRGDAVFRFNSFDLISFISSMNREVFASAPFLIGGALNVNAANFGAELDRARRKLDCGAQMLFTQPIFSDAAVENFLRAREALDCELYAGILPLAGYKNAIFLLNEVSGIEIPDAVVESLRDKPPAEAAAISIAYGTGIIRRVFDAADGFYLMTPLKRVEIVEGLMKAIRREEV